MEHKAIKDFTTQELTEELEKRESVDVINVSLEETAAIQKGPINCELKGPVKLIINYD